ncbi:UNVERIFIED_CONTAM: hypothetical protein LK11_19840 [Mumia flava]
MSTLTVRTRIVVAVAVLTLLALVLAGAAAYLVEFRRIEGDVRDQVAQEMREFETLQGEGIDPQTGEPFATADRLLDLFLSRNQPDDNERLLVVNTNGSRAYVGRSAGAPFGDPAFEQALGDLEESGGSQVIETVDGDSQLVAVRPVSDPSGSGAFVVTWNLTDERATLRSLILTYAAVAAISWLAITLVAWLTAGRLLRPVRDLSDATRAIADSADLSQRIGVEGRDDLSELSRTFNAMLERLEQAFASQRDLLDDAGHELRTPLTVLRGHLELVDVADPAEVSATRALLLDEIDRMSLLVEDLLVLAKARRPDFVVPAPVVVADLIDDLVEKSRALGPRRWVRADAPEPSVVASIDPQRVTQAILQLAENAVRHTSDGDEIAIGAAIDGPQLTLWVRDSGRGVAPQDRERLFDRFQRGAAEAGDGFGLGLAIATAIARAHDGYLALDPDDPDRPGATFRLVLPSRPVTRGEP